MTIWTPTRLLALGATLAGAAALYGIAPVRPASAADIRAQLTPELVVQHCLANGVGSNVEGGFILANGQRLTGSVLCGPEDMLAPAKSARGHDDDDGEGEFEDAGGDDD